MIYLKDSKIKITGARQVAKVFQGLLALEDQIDQDKEHYYVCHLNVRNRIKMIELVSIGTLTGALVSPRETFTRAVIARSCAIIIAHNHPSGETDPSEQDVKITKIMIETGKILGITMLDHIIFTKDSYYSYREERGGENT